MWVEWSPGMGSDELQPHLQATAPLRSVPRIAETSLIRPGRRRRSRYVGPRRRLAPDSMSTRIVSQARVGRLRYCLNRVACDVHLPLEDLQCGAG